MENNSKKVVIYTTPTCGYCKMAKQFFRDHAIAYEEKDVLADEAARNYLIERSGQLGVPVITVDDNLVIGFNQRQLAELLDLN